MPFEIQKKDKCYSVVNTMTGHVYSECTTEKKAKKQLRILENYETSWRGLMIQNIRGRKFESRQAYIDALKKLSEQYQSQF